MRLLAVAGVLAGAIVLASASPAMACDCSGDIDDAQSASVADAVFIGTPERYLEARDGGSGFAITVFQVSDVYKGDVLAEQPIATSDLSSCGIDFPPDEIYVVFARSDAPELGDLEDGIYYAASCTGTRIVGDAGIALTGATAPTVGGIDNDTLLDQLGNPRGSLVPEAIIGFGVLTFVVGLVAWLNRSGRSAT